ncbi:MAG: hypothetical protein M1817_004149 [Caeruleum heppii]|nr:MAG: hypothetical protein M1817_004149 [Caeruleum heppii]
MPQLCPRIHFLEINDQSWFPSYLRQKVQACLTLVWGLRLPFIQTASPAHLVANTLRRVLAGKTTDYKYVDFCAGAGGPTPIIERHLNEQLRSPSSNEDDHGVQFLMTDLHPHIEAWEEACKQSAYLSYVAHPVDAANAPKDMIRRDGKKVFRLYNLAFHHFDDPLAREILRNTLATADGFGIFELQDRTISSLITVFLMGPLLFLISPFYFWRSPGHLFFTYIIPIIPLVVVFDGYVSSLRTRNAKEILNMLKDSGDLEDWRFDSGSEQHTWPTGYMIWFSGVKK